VFGLIRHRPTAESAIDDGDVEGRLEQKEGYGNDVMVCLCVCVCRVLLRCVGICSGGMSGAG